MARLKNMIPPGEAILWEAFRKRSAMEIAVTDRQVIWAGGGVFDRDKGEAPLTDIRFVDLEEGGNSVNLYCDGAIYRIEEIKPGKLEELARAIGRPARIWRQCKAPAAVLGTAVAIVSRSGYCWPLRRRPVRPRVPGPRGRCINENRWRRGGRSHCPTSILYRGDREKHTSTHADRANA